MMHILPITFFHPPIFLHLISCPSTGCPILFLFRLAVVVTVFFFVISCHYAWPFCFSNQSRISCSVPHTAPWQTSGCVFGPQAKTYIGHRIMKSTSHFMRSLPVWVLPPCFPELAFPRLTLTSLIARSPPVDDGAVPVALLVIPSLPVPHLTEYRSLGDWEVWGLTVIPLLR